MDSLELMTSQHVVFTAFDDGEGVLVDLNSKQYFRLNQTAMFVWSGIEKGKRPAEIAGEMTDEYEVTPEQAMESVKKFLGNLKSFKLVRPKG